MIKNKRGSLALVISVLSILAILLNSNPTFANEVSDSVDGVSVKLVAKKKHNIRKSFDPSSPILDNLVVHCKKEEVYRQRIGMLKHKELITCKEAGVEEIISIPIIM